MSSRVTPFPTYNTGIPLDLRRPMNLEEAIKDIVEKTGEDAKETPERTIEIVMGTELMMDIALRLLAVESRLPGTPDHREAAENRP